MSYISCRKFRIVSLSMVFFLLTLLLPTGLLGQHAQTQRDNYSVYSYAEDIDGSIFGDDMVEVLEDSPIFEDAIVESEGYVDKDFDIDAIIDDNATEKNYHGDDGYTYTVSSIKHEDGSSATYLTSNKNDAVLEFTENFSENELNVTNYEPIIGESGSFAINSVTIDISAVDIVEDNPVQPAATTWNSKKYLSASGILPKCGNYWYQDGVNGKKDYLKIGCEATYTITLNDLSSTRTGMCNSYKSNIKKSNDSYSASKISGASAKLLTVLTSAIAALLVGGTLTAGASALVGIVVGILGSAIVTASGVSITKFIDSAKHAYAAKEDYAIIKKY